MKVLILSLQTSLAQLRQKSKQTFEKTLDAEPSMIYHEPRIEHLFDQRKPGDAMYADSQRKISLIPIIIFAAFSLFAWLPLVSAIHVEAASPRRIAVVTVEPGDTVWSIASQHIPAGVEMDEFIDRIVSANKLHDAQLSPGQKLRLPE